MLKVLQKASKYIHNYGKAKHAVNLMEMINCKFKEFLQEKGVHQTDINEVIALAEEGNQN